MPARGEVAPSASPKACRAIRTAASASIVADSQAKPVVEAKSAVAAPAMAPSAV